MRMKDVGKGGKTLMWDKERAFWETIKPETESESSSDRVYV